MASPFKGTTNSKGKKNMSETKEFGKMFRYKGHIVEFFKELSTEVSTGGTHHWHVRRVLIDGRDEAWQIPKPEDKDDNDAWETAIKKIIDEDF